MAAFTRAGVPDVFGAVVADLELARVERGLERRAQAVHARGGVHGADSSFVKTPRSRYSTTPTMKTMASGTAIQTLKVTQSASLRVLAIQMFANPSRM